MRGIPIFFGGGWGGGVSGERERGRGRGRERENETCKKPLVKEPHKGAIAANLKKKNKYCIWESTFCVFTFFF